ncbi:M14 family zinc carboxypeptidase [Ereboglobus luteus]|uniref:Peptidase M14 domain-containing protein n=1 Tax=Ereboglobus luteus TaxID=1796921 RepID=A0A2U8E4Q6_9BACT|nr:M14 family zinc carboxypeptidase [Ereboglobus luteus]AWI09800.1 hypothetical protein CKA38_11550 [Ereboglobus luteus]
MKKHILSSLLAVLLIAGSTAAASAAEKTKVEIDAGFPGGNIIVVDAGESVVQLKQDLRDTKGRWFYWSFRVRGAQGKTLEFQFDDKIISYLGPAISKDGGKTWTWLYNKTGNLPYSAVSSAFKYTFGKDDTEVFFSLSPNYTEKELNAFLEKHKTNPALKIGTLCKTTKGRNAELLRVAGQNPKSGFKVALTARHHACETMASYALEGIVDTILSDTPDGRWLREHADFLIVPFMDKDGVEDGDQGKNRKPHDHNRDYAKEIHPTVRAFKKQVSEWIDGRPAVLFDMHCPSEKGKTLFFFTEAAELNKKISDNVNRYCSILEAERKSPLYYKKSHNRIAKNSKNPALVKCNTWFMTLPETIAAMTLEIPYALAADIGATDGAAVTADRARLFGKDMAKALRIFLETQP